MKRLKEIRNSCSDKKLYEVLEIACKAALSAGEVLRNRYLQPHQIKHKGDIDLVTEADLASEETILTIIKHYDPQGEILAEESHSSFDSPPNVPVWIIDPLDGTTNFAHGFPWFGISIAYGLPSSGLVGAIYCPLQDELFFAIKGCSAWLNGLEIRVSQEAKLESSLLATGFPYDIQKETDVVIDTLKTILKQCQGVRRAGAAALDMAYVACGRLDGFWEIKLKPWDTAAGFLLVEEAGGSVSDFRGNNYSPFLPEVVATNGKIHNELINLLKPFSIIR